MHSSGACCRLRLFLRSHAVRSRSSNALTIFHFYNTSQARASAPLPCLTSAPPRAGARPPPLRCVQPPEVRRRRATAHLTWNVCACMRKWDAACGTCLPPCLLIDGVWARKEHVHVGAADKYFAQRFLFYIMVAARSAAAWLRLYPAAQGSKAASAPVCSLPYRTTPHPPLTHVCFATAAPLQVTDMICKMARKGMTPSQIGVLLRDSNGIPQVRSSPHSTHHPCQLSPPSTPAALAPLPLWIAAAARHRHPPHPYPALLTAPRAAPQVRSITGSKILRLLKSTGLAPEIPEDLYHLIKKAVSMRKHLERSRKDKDAKFRLILVESRIHRLARYYKVRPSAASAAPAAACRRHGTAGLGSCHGCRPVCCCLALRVLERYLLFVPIARHSRA